MKAQHVVLKIAIANELSDLGKGVRMASQDELVTDITALE